MRDESAQAEQQGKTDRRTGSGGTRCGHERRRGFSDERAEGRAGVRLKMSAPRIRRFGRRMLGLPVPSSPLAPRRDPRGEVAAAWRVGGSGRAASEHARRMRRRHLITTSSPPHVEKTCPARRTRPRGSRRPPKERACRQPHGNVADTERSRGADGEAGRARARTRSGPRGERAARIEKERGRERAGWKTHETKRERDGVAPKTAGRPRAPTALRH